MFLTIFQVTILRVKAIISYDGSRYFGSQKLLCNQQITHPTVQQEIESFLSAHKIPKDTLFSGRTDRDVHATGQVISFDVPQYWKNLDKLKQAMNKRFVHIQIKSLFPTDDDFHPRFQAKKRSYRYIISTKKVSPFQASYFTFFENFDLQKAKQSIQSFVGEHDFEYFRKSGSDEKTTTRVIYSARVYQHKEFMILK